MNLGKEVVITGMGALTPLGNDVETTWNNALAGLSGVTDAPKISDNSKVLYSGSVRGFDIKTLLKSQEERKEIRDWGICTRLAIGAASEALNNAGLLNSEHMLDGVDSYSIGCIVGSGGGDTPHIIDAERERTGLLGRIKPSTTKALGLEKPPGAVAKFFGLNGHSSLIAAACASSGEALYLAESLIKSGKMDIMLVIGAEGTHDLNEDGSLRYPLWVELYEGLGALSTWKYSNPTQASRPFDYQRDGFVPAEGAIGLVLESKEHALDRKIKPLAKITTVTTNNASGSTEPDVVVMAATFRKALKEVGLYSKDIDLIIPHATSTPLGDISEKAAILMAFGETTRHILMCAIKSLTGHMLGASGGMGALIAVKAIQEGKTPPTLNYKGSEDMSTDMRAAAGLTEKLANSQLWLPNKIISDYNDTILNSTFGFGGHNAVSILQRC